MPRLQGRRWGRSTREPVGWEEGELHTPLQVSRSARSRPGESESGLLCSWHPCPWAGHGAVVLLPRGRRTCAAPRPPRRLSGTRKAGEQGCSPARGVCQAASPRTHLSCSHCRYEVYPAVGPRLWRQRVPRCQSSSRGLTRFLLTKSAPLRPRALPLPLKLSARSLTLQAEAAGIFLSVQDSPGCLANPARRWDGREGDRCAERWPRRRRRNSQSPASWRCATRSSQRGLSGALLAQVPHSSPRDSPPSRLTDRRAANRDAHLSCI